MSHINFHDQSKTKSDNYETPFYVFKDIAYLVDKERTIYDPFYCSGSSGLFLSSLFENVIHQDVDFFNNSFQYDMIISNPPYSKLKLILEKIERENKPFMLLMPLTLLTRKYFKTIFNKKEIKIIIPKSRIHFTNVECVSTCKSKSYFDTAWFCFGIDTLQNQITFL